MKKHWTLNCLGNTLPGDVAIAIAASFVLWIGYAAQTLVHASRQPHYIAIALAFHLTRTLLVLILAQLLFTGVRRYRPPLLAFWSVRLTLALLAGLFVTFLLQGCYSLLESPFGGRPYTYINRLPSPQYKASWQPPIRLSLGSVRRISAWSRGGSGFQTTSASKTVFRMEICETELNQFIADNLTISDGYEMFELQAVVDSHEVSDHMAKFLEEFNCDGCGWVEPRVGVPECETSHFSWIDSNHKIRGVVIYDACTCELWIAW